MYKNILIPLELNHETDAADTLALADRLLAEGGSVTLLGVIEEVPSYVAEFVTVKPARGLAENMGERLRAIAGNREGIQVAVKEGKPGVVIAEFADASGADLIIVRSQRPGAAEYFLGSTASRVVRRAPCAVMVLR